jgi:myo-inositol-1(or 4)-monophosphatase
MRSALVGTVPPVTASDLVASDILTVFDDLVADLVDALADLDDWGPSGGRSDQYRHDVVADDVLLGGLHRAGFSVLSEESGITGSGPITVVVDPVDGSTNASRGLPWYAASLCAVDAEGPLAASVVNLATGVRFQAMRGAGVETDRPIVPSTCRRLADAVVGMTGWAPSHGGWAQYRAYGAAALDLCNVATGVLDGWFDVDDALGVWDYLGAYLICEEAGVPIVDARGRDLVVLDPAERRAPIAAATPELLVELQAMWDGWRPLL